MLVHLSSIIMLFNAWEDVFFSNLEDNNNSIFPQYFKDHYRDHEDLIKFLYIFFKIIVFLYNFKFI